MVGKSTSNVSIVSITDDMATLETDNTMITCQSDCSGEREPILFGCPSIPRRYHGTTSSQVFLRGRRGAKLHLCSRATAHVTTAFISPNQTVRARGGGSAVQPRVARTTSDRKSVV